MLNIGSGRPSTKMGMWRTFAAPAVGTPALFMAAGRGGDRRGGGTGPPRVSGTLGAEAEVLMGLLFGWADGWAGWAAGWFSGVFSGMVE